MWAGAAKLDVLAKTPEDAGCCKWTGWAKDSTKHESGVVLKRDLEEGVPVSDDWHHLS